jgi:hypothetical protein
MESNQFFFKNFLPSIELEQKANQLLLNVQALSPYDSRILALMEQTDHSFCCSIDIYSKYGPFMARSQMAEPETALASMVAQITEKLQEWRNQRFGDGSTQPKPGELEPEKTI